MAHPDHYLLYIEYFNNRKYQSAQMILDQHWNHVPASDPSKKFYQGLIQMAVALFHLTQEDAKRAVMEFTKARPMLAEFAPRHLDLNVKKFLSEMDELFEKHVNPDEKKDYSRLIPRIELHSG